MIEPAQGLLYRFEEACDSVGEFVQVFGLALPNRHDRPAVLPKQSRRLPVPCAVSVDLCRPETNPRLWRAALAARMAMPKAAVYKHDFSTRTKHEVGLSRKIGGVKCVAEAPAMKRASDRHFGPGVFGFDSSHDLAAGFGCDAVHTQV